eukprot:10526935-Alexandrium_andersonii.AAC.1
MDTQSDTLSGGAPLSSWPPLPFLGVHAASEPAPMKLASFRDHSGKRLRTCCHRPSGRNRWRSAAG